MDKIDEIIEWAKKYHSFSYREFKDGHTRIVAEQVAEEIFRELYELRLDEPDSVILTHLSDKDNIEFNKWLINKWQRNKGIKKNSDARYDYVREFLLEKLKKEWVIE